MLKWRVRCLKTSCSILILTRRSNQMRKKLVSHLATLVLSLSCSLTHAATEDNKKQRFVDGARKEGSKVINTSVETGFARSMSVSFEAKYPFIKTDIFR